MVCSMETAIASAPVKAENLKAFSFAGNATATFVSNATGKRFTFKVRQPKPEMPHFVSLLSGPNNENDFSFLGSVFASGEYRHGSRSSVSPSAPSAIAAKWVVERVVKGLPLNGCEVYHEGRCGKCNRKLTVPESIETGIGPECAKRLGL
jgi:hypothetical protein